MTEKRKTDWPAATVKFVPIDKLVPYANNARTHSDKQIAQIAASIKEWGFTNPVLVDEAGTILAGHGRILAAKQLGFDQVPVMTATGWTEKQKRGYVLADNRIAANSDWDMMQLSNELSGLKQSDFDIALTGFSEKELVDLQGYNGPSGVSEVQTSKVDDKFWISIRGPLADQAKVLKGIKAVVNATPGAELDLGIISLDL